MKKILFFLLPLSLIGQSTLLVPSQYNLIQEAIDASSNGDTISVSSGTYYENLDFNEKDLVLVSDFIINNDTNYINSTIIDGMNNGRVLNINNNTASVIGFTITNGSHPGGAGIYTSEANIVLSDLKIINNDASDDGGGIHCHASSMDLRNSKILSNTAQVFGGGVFVENCTTQNVNIINSVISNNQCFSNGGGIYIGNSTVTIDSCQVTNNNSTQNSGTHGGGISIWLESDVSIEHSLIKGNVSNTGGGIYVGRSDVLLNYNDVSLNSAFNDGGGVTLSTWGSGNFNASIINCTFYDNWADQISSNGIKVAESTGDYIITILNSIIWEKIDGFIDFVEYSNTQQPSSGVGNISLIPDLVDVSPTSPNYNLNSTSPCIDAGNPSPIYNDPNGTRNDMGAYPYEPCINNTSISYTDITVCDSYTWYDSTYTQSGTYSFTGSNNNYSMSFDGADDYINFPDIPMYGPTYSGEFSFTAYVYAGAETGTDYFNIVSTDDNSSGNLLQWGCDDENLLFSLHTSNGGIFSNTPINRYEWTYVSVTYDGSNISFYINGNLDHSEPASININSSVTIIGHYLLGSSNLDSQEPWNGYLDNIGIWHKSLSQQEIQNYMNCPPNGNEQNLVLYWDFEEGSGDTLYDLTSNGNDGILVNGPNYSTNVPSQFCNLTNVNGCDSTVILNLTINNTDTSYTDITACDSYTWNDSTYNQSGTYYSNTVDINNNTSILFEESKCIEININSISDSVFTLTSWIKTDNQDNGYIFMNGVNGWTNDFNFAIQYNSGLIELNVITPSGFHFANSTTNISDNEWYFITFVYENNTAKLFVNGNEEISINNLPSINNDLYPLIIGSKTSSQCSNDDGSGSVFNGLVDDVAIWNTSLDQTQIQFYMTCPPNGNEIDLLGYWNFEEGTGNIVYDLTSNGNDGTINGAIYSTDAPLYTCALTNQLGCDSLAVLNLTINNTDTSIIDITACDSYTWNDSTYTESGTYYSNTVDINNNYSMLFDGSNDYAQISNLTHYNSFSSMCWFNFNSLSQYDAIMQHKGTCNNASGWYIGVHNGFLRVFKHIGNCTNNCPNYPNSSCNFNILTNIAINTSQWYHIALVSDGSNNIIYLDGDSILNIYESTPYPTQNSPFTIGAHSEGSWFYSDINIDDVTYFNSVLSQSDIQSYMNCSPNGNEQNLILYWNFEEGSGNTVLDLTLNGNNGAINGATYDINVPTQSCALTNSYGCDSVAVINLTINNTDTSYTSVTACDSVVWNGTTYTQSGTYSYSGTSNNYSMSFDNNGEYLNSNVNTTSSQDATWMGWFYFDDLVQNGMIAQNNGYNTNGYYINTSNIPGSQNVPQTSVYLSTAIGNTNQLAQTWTNANAITSNKWHHVAISLSNGIASIYIDGLYNVAGNNFNHQIQASSADFLIGVGTDLVGSLTQVMNGDIDDISVWNTALSQAEIQQYMNCPPTGNETGLVGYWNFEEGSGSTTYDQTSNGNNVTINGATYDTNVPAQSCALTNANGCDSIEVLSLTINNSITTTNTVSICSGDSFSVGTSTYNTAGTYIDTLTTTDGCDSTVTTTLTIDPLGCTDASAFNYDANAICDDGSCIAIVNGCMDSTACNYDSTANIDDGSCNYATSSMTDITACDSYTWNDSAYTQSGTYSYSGSSAVNDYSMSFDGVNDYLLLDSSLNIQNLNGVSFSLWIKNNWNITDPNSTQPQDYIFDFESNSSVVSRFNFSYGVDGVINWEVGSCQPPSWSYNIGQENQYDNEWIYITLTVDSNEKRIYINGDLKDLTYNSCPFNNFDYSGGVNRIGDNSSQTPYQPFTGKIDNFSIWNTVLTQQEIQQYMNCSPAGSEASLVGYWNFEEGTGSIAYDQTSNGNNVTINGSTYDTNVPSQSCSLINSNGCDSTAVLNLTINNSVTTTNTVSICSGDSFSVGTSTYNTDGIYTDTLTTTDGCDSTVTTTLTIDPLGCTDASAFNYDANAICDDGSCIAVVNGCMDSTACNYDFSANTDDGSCNYATSSTTDVTECDSYDWNGTTYTTSGSYTYATTNAVGCDSTATLNLTINSSSTSTTDVTACDSYDWNGTTYTTSGSYTYATNNAVGCDSVATLNLTIDPSTSSTTDITACNSYSWNGTTYSSSGQYTWLGVNSNDCDSVATLNLTINSSSTSTTDVTECESYVWNGTTYTTSGSYTYTTTNAVGCDSVATLNLTIDPSTSSTTDITACNNYSWNGTTYSSSGQYTWLGVNSNDCDSVATLNLTINSSSSSTTDVTECDSYMWNGTTYTTSGSYTYSTTNVVGCDSTATLNLTINSSSTSTTDVTECDSYVWNGTTYTTSGSYTYVTTNAVGCDSTATINLTLYESIIVDTVFSICKGDSVSINNIWYTQADTVTNYLYTAHNCDSVVTSTIEVTDSLKCNITRTDDYLLAETMGGTPPYYFLWSTGDTTQNLVPTVNGTYWVVISDSYGCSSDTCFFNIDWIPSFTSDYGIKNLYLYPNPTRNIFNIEFSSLSAQDLEIKVRNSIGEIFFHQSLYDFNTNYKKKISLKNRSKGIYFIEINTNNGVIHNKIILQ